MMEIHLSDSIRNILICPVCGQPLGAVENDAVECGSCGALYPFTKTGSLDLRLPKAIHVTQEFEIGGAAIDASQIDMSPLVVKGNPEVDFSKIDVPYHLTKELLSHFPKAKTDSSQMLDLGCGGTIHRSVCEFAGFEYVGLDYDSPGAPFLGDGHRLPFKDDSFEFILSIAVLEHIQYPFLMMCEAYRVLKPGGRLIGTVAFLEPYHLRSYYHHSHLGTLNALQYGGFEVQQIAPHENWSVLKAQAVMALFFRLPRRLAEFLVAPLDWLSKMWWRARWLRSWGKRVDLSERIRNTTGAFSFIAMKDPH
jgi:SAM-dependent methyltransferase